MLLAFLSLAISMQDLVPARWPSSEVTSLELLKGTPVNCVLLEQPWSREFVGEAGRRGVSAMAVIHPTAEAPGDVRKAMDAGFPAVVLEGAFEPELRGAIRKMVADAKLS